MPVLTNVLTGDTNKFAGTVGTWYIPDGYNHSITDTYERVRYAGNGSMKLTALSDDPVIVRTGDFPFTDQTGWPSRASLTVYSSVAVTIDLSIEVTPGPVIATSSTGVNPIDWTVCSVEGPIPQPSAVGSLRVQVHGMQPGDFVYITNPRIIVPNIISRNVFAAEVWARLPEYLRETDRAQSSPDFPLLRFLDVLTANANDGYALWETHRYIPPEDSPPPGRVSMLDPAVADVKVLRWWAQILGVRFYDPSVGATSWGNFMSGLDPDGDPEWFDWMSVPDANADGDVTWQELQAFAPEVVGLASLLRWQAQTAFYGYRSGTKRAMIESTRQILTGTKYVNLVPRADNDPWKIRIETRFDETPDTNAPGEDSPLVLEIVENARPAGFEVVSLAVA